jgi:sec-independent protein translocase protein TatA
MGLDNPIHILFLLVLALLVFGAKRLPEMGRSLGEGMRGFKDSLNSPSTPAATLTPATALTPATSPTPAPAPTPATADVSIAEPVHASAEPVHSA